MDSRPLIVTTSPVVPPGHPTPLIPSFPRKRESTLQSSTALVTTPPVVPPDRHSGLPLTVIVEPALDSDRRGGSLCPPAETHNPPLISSFPRKRESTFQSSTALVTTFPVVPPDRHSGLPLTVIVEAGPCARPRKPTTRPSFRHSRESGNPQYNYQPHLQRHPPWFPRTGTVACPCAIKTFLLYSKMTWFPLLFALGACLGSFVNLVSLRLPALLDGQLAIGDRADVPGLLRPGSRCTACLTPLRFHHNIPIASFIFLSGRCGFCTARISPRYPAIEVIAALSAVTLSVVYEPDWQLAARDAFCLCLAHIEFDRYGSSGLAGPACPARRIMS